MLIWARRSARLTEDEAAQRIGASVDRVAQWEQGTHEPTITLTKVGSVVVPGAVGGDLAAQDIPVEVDSFYGCRAERLQASQPTRDGQRRPGPALVGFDGAPNA
ncbi:helix-turn-helix domain-containing protein [Leifsonia aquatica]|uniref:helix-turn-helix domain-containing protein n=1 Tax=Leifsonia aquatica TaxID=144185 RepID=UPI0028A8DE3A|nr:helix-turn-helix transcriptional regulator [Leifsonia aquatica]